MKLVHNSSPSVHVSSNIILIFVKIILINSQNHVFRQLNMLSRIAHRSPAAQCAKIAWRAAGTRSIVAPRVERSAGSTWVQGVRGFASKGKVPVPSSFSDSEEVLSLSDALATEIAEEVAEESVDQELEDIKAQIKKSFSITDEAGKGVVHLHGTIRGSKVQVTFDCQDEADSGFDADGFSMPPEGDQQGSNDEVPSIDFGINFTVRISSSNGDKIIVDCVASQQLQVLNVQHVSAGKSDEDSELYGGPTFDQLSEGLQDAIYDYLEDHKIDDDMCFFVLSYSRAKEQTEYVNWLNALLLTAESGKK